MIDDYIIITVKGRLYETPSGKCVDFDITLYNERTNKTVHDDYHSISYYDDGSVGMGYCDEDWDCGRAMTVIEFLNFLTGENWDENLRLLGRKMIEMNTEYVEETREL